MNQRWSGIKRKALRANPPTEKALTVDGRREWKGLLIC